MGAADALAGRKMKEYMPKYEISSVTNKIITGLGLNPANYDFFHDTIGDIFEPNSEFEFINDTFGLGRILMKTAGGITMYLPFFDKTFIDYPDFDCYHNEATKDSLRIVDTSLHDKIKKVYDEIPDDQKGLYISQYRKNHKQKASSGISQNAENLLTAVQSLMFFNEGDYVGEAANIFIYRYGDYYHFGTGDCVNPAAHLLDIYHVLTIHRCFDV